MKLRQPTEGDFRTILDCARQESELGERRSLKQQTCETEQEIMDAMEEDSFVPGQYITFENNGRKEYDWIFLGSEKSGNHPSKVKVTKNREIKSLSWPEFGRMQENINIDPEAIKMTIDVLNEKLDRFYVDLESRKKTTENTKEAVLLRYRIGELAGLLDFNAE